MCWIKLNSNEWYFCHSRCIRYMNVKRVPNLTSNDKHHLTYLLHKIKKIFIHYLFLKTGNWKLQYVCIKQFLMVWQVLSTTYFRAISIYIYDSHYYNQFDGNILEKKDIPFLCFPFFRAILYAIWYSITFTKDRLLLESRIKKNNFYTNWQFNASHDVDYKHLKSIQWDICRHWNIIYSNTECKYRNFPN